MKKTEHGSKKESDKKNQLISRLNGFIIDYFNYFVLAVVVLIMVIGLVFFITPEYRQTVNELNEIKARRQKEYEASQQYLAQLNQLNSIYNKVNPDDLKKIENLLPSRAETEDLLSQLEAIAANNGLLLTSLEVDTGNKNKNVNLSAVDKIKIKMNVVGLDYVGLKNILRTIENNLRLMDIVNLSFSPAESAASFEIDTYYLK